MISAKRWKKTENTDTVQISYLAEVLNVDTLIASLLVHRGIKTFEEAKRFFRPEFTHLHDPYLMKDMNKAITRIDEALIAHEKIMIYGDYDVDGTTSVAVVYSYFKNLDANLIYYLPNREKEGYGVSIKGIDFAATQNVGLIIALDCGITASKQVDYAKSLNIDFIIGDHHLPAEGKIPNAVAVLDPKRSDCEYPYTELSGCGIGFKIIQAFAIFKELPLEQVYDYLDLVVVSIASDIVPITGENRVLAYYGLKKINSNPRPGLEALLTLAARKSTLTISDLVFGVGPRINAAGRMGDARLAVDLLVCKNLDEADSIAQIINVQNTNRRDLDSSITEEALAVLDSEIYKSKKSTVLYKANWHKGVIGIVASRLIEKHHRPTIVLADSNGCAVGSARSVSRYNIYEAISKCKDLLEQFGGHNFAAGVKIKHENIPLFQERFEQVVSETITEEQLTPEIYVDVHCRLKDITPKFVRILDQFEPFGPGNMAPVFESEDLVDHGHARVVGTHHLKLCVKQHDSFSYDAIAFQMGEFLPQLSNGERFKMLYSLEKNEWNGICSTQLNVKDIKVGGI